MVEFFTWIKFQTCETQLLILAITECSSILNLFFHLTEIMCLLANPHQSLLTGLQWSSYFHEFSIFHSVQKWYQIVCLQDFIQHVFHVYSSCKCHSLFFLRMNTVLLWIIFFLPINERKIDSVSWLLWKINRNLFCWLFTYVHAVIIYKRLQKQIFELVLIFEKLIIFFINSCSILCLLQQYTMAPFL